MRVFRNGKAVADLPADIADATICDTSPAVVAHASTDGLPAPPPALPRAFNHLACRQCGCCRRTPLDRAGAAADAGVMLRRTFLLAPPALLGACAGTPITTPPGDLWFAFLETGRPTPADKDAVAAMQRGHIENFKRLFAQGRLLAAGPLADPARHKRGIVVLRGASPDELATYFQPDDYVREGYMTLNARRAVAHAPLHTEGIDASRVEEARIVLIGREPPPHTTRHLQGAIRIGMLQGLVNAGKVGAWYSLADGPVAHVLLLRGTDTSGLQDELAVYADWGPPVTIDIWRQWISPGVIGPR